MGLERIFKLVQEAFEEGAIEGYNAGYDDGYDDGVDSTKDEFKSAVSDGLRHKSGECGKAMNRLKK